MSAAVTPLPHSLQGSARFYRFKSSQRVTRKFLCCSVSRTPRRVPTAEEAEQLRTDLVSAGVEEVAQAHDVAVVQLPHDLQLAVLQDKTEEKKASERRTGDLLGGDGKLSLVRAAFSRHFSGGIENDSLAAVQQQQLSRGNIRDSATSVVVEGGRVSGRVSPPRAPR